MDDPDDFEFVRDVPLADKKMFFAATYNILMRIYSYICSGQEAKLGRFYDPGLLWKMQDFRSIWESFVDSHEESVKQQLSKSDLQALYKNNTRNQIYANFVSVLFRPPTQFMWKLGETFVADNFIYLGEIIQELPGPANEHESDHTTKTLRMIIHRIFMLDERVLERISQNADLRKLLIHLNDIFREFVVQHKNVIDPLFQEYGPEVLAGRMQWVSEDNDILNSLTPMSFLLDTIKSEMFDVQRSERLLQGQPSEVQQNHIIVINGLAELFVKDNIEELQVITKQVLLELRKFS